MNEIRERVTVGGWTATGRFLGKCKCGNVIRHEDFPTTAPTMKVECPCGATVVAKQVFGYTTEKTCDARCMNATGPDCECGCGGFNHGANH